MHFSLYFLFLRLLAMARISSSALSVGFSPKRRDFCSRRGSVSTRPVKIGGFLGQKLVLGKSVKGSSPHVGSVKMSLTIGKAMKWWTKGTQPNMQHISSAEDLVNSLNNAGDKLVIVDFFSPGCGGCKALHPKICQLAEMNPNVVFLQVNYEDHKSMCYSLNVHVLPFFRFYRGAQGRLCSFSCTNATIKKFKDALAKHTPDRCSLGPTKGLEESELLALAANKSLAFTYTKKPALDHADVASPTPAGPKIQEPEPTIATSHLADDKNLVSSGR